MGLRDMRIGALNKVQERYILNLARVDKVCEGIRKKAFVPSQDRTSTFAISCVLEYR